MTGADVTMAGVTGAMMGGVLTASAILRRNLMSVVTKGVERSSKDLRELVQATSK